MNAPTIEDRAFADQVHDCAYSFFPMAADNEAAQIDAIAKLVMQFRIGCELTGYRKRDREELPHNL